MNVHRVFIGVDLPDKLKHDIAAVANELKSPGIRLVSPENLHITLKFLGDVDETTIEKLKETLGEILFTSFSASFSGLGVFPSISRPRVIWVGVESGKEEILHLWREIEKVTSRMGFRKEKRFVPHVTIGRVKRTSPEVNRLIRRVLEIEKDKDFGHMDVKSFKLKKSKLTPSGPVYSDLHIFNARGE